MIQEQKVTGGSLECRAFTKQLCRDFPAASISISEFGHYVWIWDFGVRELSRGKGIGAEVMRRVQAWCSETQKDICLTMEAEPGHEAGLARFYGRLGFVTVSGNDLIWRWNVPRGS